MMAPASREVGHALGIGRPLDYRSKNTAHSIMSYADDTKYCRPQAYDLLSMMTVCQPR